jgi:hypothetical protein
MNPGILKAKSSEKPDAIKVEMLFRVKYSENRVALMFNTEEYRFSLKLIFPGEIPFSISEIGRANKYMIRKKEHASNI